MGALLSSVVIVNVVGTSREDHWLASSYVHSNSHLRHYRGDVIDDMENYVLGLEVCDSLKCIQKGEDKVSALP